MSILRELGLTENEVKVYTTLLKIGSATVSVIAERSGLYRPYVYDTLERLEEKGLVSFLKKNNKKHFKAAHPSQLIEREKEKLEELQKLMPQLEEFLKLPKEEASVELYAGKKIVRVVQKDVLKTLMNKKEENLVIGVDEKRFMNADSVIMNQYFHQMQKYKLKERVLVRKGDTFLPGHKLTTQYRFLPRAYFSPTSTFIYGENVAIILFTEPLYGLIIRSNALAKAYRRQFEILWKSASV
ncbi:MarR family transcriptional regulator [Candidatus Woesearchaeota archaeon]|nr:MAG: MarR family transcriptional regulator [Candidatus Woesearchaeota archaeon]